MFWKRFRSAQSAGKFFNQANEHWHQRQRFLLEGDEESERDACAEVIRLCQLSIQADQRSGDAYVLLANALTVATSHGPGRSDQERYEFLQSRAAAVIHLWYTLPHRGYPTTKINNTAIGERLWRIMVDDISQDKSLPEDATVALVESYRDNLAAETTSPDSFEKIKGIILRTASTPQTKQPEPREPLEETLTPETYQFLARILRKAMPGESHEEQVRIDPFSQLKEMTDELGDNSRIYYASTELIELIKQAHHDNDFRQAICWLNWLFILENYSHKHRKKYLPDEEKEEDYGAKLWKMVFNPLKITINMARQAKDWDAILLAVSLLEWVDIPEWRDELLGIVYDHIDEQAVADRLLNIKRQPRMLIEDAMVKRLQCYLGKT